MHRDAPNKRREFGVEIEDASFVAALDPPPNRAVAHVLLLDVSLPCDALREAVEALLAAVAALWPGRGADSADADSGPLALVLGDGRRVGVVDVSGATPRVVWTRTTPTRGPRGRRPGGLLASLVPPSRALARTPAAREALCATLRALRPVSANTHPGPADAALAPQVSVAAEVALAGGAAAATVVVATALDAGGGSAETAAAVEALAPRGAEVVLLLHGARQQAALAGDAVDDAGGAGDAEDEDRLAAQHRLALLTAVARAGGTVLPWAAGAGVESAVSVPESAASRGLPAALCATLGEARMRKCSWRPRTGSGVVAAWRGGIGVPDEDGLYHAAACRFGASSALRLRHVGNGIESADQTVAQVAVAFLQQRTPTARLSARLLVSTAAFPVSALAADVLASTSPAATAALLAAHASERVSGRVIGQAAAAWARRLLRCVAGADVRSEELQAAATAEPAASLLRLAFCMAQPRFYGAHAAAMLLRLRVIGGGPWALTALRPALVPAGASADAVPLPLSRRGLLAGEAPAYDFHVLNRVIRYVPAPPALSRPPGAVAGQETETASAADVSGEGADCVVHAGSPDAACVNALLLDDAPAIAGTGAPARSLSDFVLELCK